MPTAPAVHPWLLAAAAGVVAIALVVFVVRLLLGVFRTPPERDE